MSHPTDPDASSATSPAGPDEAPATSTRPISAGWALVPIVTLIATLATVILILPSYEEGFEGTGHLPLIISGSVAALIARWHGWRWPLIKDGVLHAIHLSMGAILILIVIGMLMGTWLISGIVPALIDWGLMLLRPSYFLPATCAVCSVVSVVSGSSWSTAGTIGLARIGVGEVMGVPTAYTAGAVISGAYFGDKLSPMSDTTNLAPAMAGTDLFTHVRHMLWTTVPSWVISMVLYTIMGLRLSEFVQLVAPFSLYVAIVLTLGRLHADHEMVVLQGAGASTAKLLRWMATSIGAVVLVVAVLSQVVTPLSQRVLAEFMVEQRAQTEFETVNPGIFHVYDRASRVTYSQSMSEDRRVLYDVFLSQQLEDGRQVNVWAESGRQELDEARGAHFLILSNGRRYDVLDIRNPKAPVRVGSFQLFEPGASIHDVWIDDGIAYS